MSDPVIRQHERPTGEIVVYRANARRDLGAVDSWRIMAANVWRSRQLIWQLFKRDFFAVYKKSFIGYAWALIMPFAGILSWLFLQKAGVLNPGDMEIPYPVYVLVGTSMWGLFMGLFTGSAATLTSGQELVLQVRFSHEALLFQQAAQQVATFLITFALNLAVLLLYRVYPSWGVILFPLVAIPLFLMATACGLFVAMLTIVAFDLRRIIDLGMGFMMYLTPLIYADTVGTGLIRTINDWNPLTHLVCSCRDIMLYGRLYDTSGYISATALAVLAFLVSWRLFYLGEHRLIERMV